MAPKHNKGFAQAKNAKKSFFRIMSYLGRHKVLFSIVVIFIIINAVCGAAGTFLIQSLVDNAITPGIAEWNTGVYSDFFQFLGQSESGKKLVSLLLQMGGIYVAAILSGFAYKQMMVTISTSTLKAIRDDLFIHLQDLPIRYFDNNTHGDIMSRFTNDTDTLREAISEGIPVMISSAVSFLTTFILMCVLSIPLALVAVLMLFFMQFIIKFFLKRSRKFFVEQQKMVGDVNGFVEEYIEGQKVVKVFCHEKETKESFDERNEKLRHASVEAQSNAMMLFPLMGNLSYVHYILTALAGSLLVLMTNNELFEAPFMKWFFSLSVGALISFMTFAKNFSRPITEMSQQFNAFFTALAGAERIFSIIDEPAEIDEGYVELVNATRNEKGEIVEADHRTGFWAWKHPHKEDGTVTYTEMKGDVVFENVSFGYVPEKLVLKNISLYAKPGQKVAFVGSTGAGKTTITNLINRFYDINDGKIRYDGINIEKIKKDDLRRSLAMVLQDTHLFTGTVKDNIRYGKLDATDEEIYAAAKIANAHSFITHLPQGYDTMLTGDGENLSQGQRQLIAIARAAVANPPVLILDEATSSIDTRTEKLIEKGMDGLMKGRTVFVIAHRLSTVRNSDAIMVLEHGSILERGNHESLIEEKGRYYQLYTGAFELD